MTLPGLSRVLDFTPIPAQKPNFARDIPQNPHHQRLFITLIKKTHKKALKTSPLRGLFDTTMQNTS